MVYIGTDCGVWVLDKQLAKYSGNCSVASLRGKGQGLVTLANEFDHCKMPTQRNVVTVVDALGKLYMGYSQQVL